MKYFCGDWPFGSQWLISVTGFQNCTRAGYLLLYQYLLMEIEFVELEHRDDIANLMEVCGIDLQTAYNLYHRHNCNLEAAVSESLGLVSPLRAEPPPQNAHVLSQRMNASFDEEADPEFHRYCRFLEDGVPFFKKYPIRNDINLEKKEGKEEPRENLSFRKDVETFVGRRVNLKVEVGRIEDGLRYSWKERFPIAVLILNFEEECGESLRACLTKDSLANEICTYFKLYGLDPASRPLDKWLAPFISLPADLNSLLVLRVNCMDEVQTVARIRLAEGSPESVGKLVQRAKSDTIHREYDEAHLIKQHALIRKGAGAYRRPPSMQERLKHREDARLRRQQDEEFMKACKPKQEEASAAKKEEPRVSEQQLKNQREQKRKKLTVHSEGLHFKMRMPSGKTVQLLVDGSEPVQYLFDYVESSAEEIGFERDHKRCFDIVFGPEKNKSLLAAREGKIEGVLEQFQLLIVKEIDE